VPAPSGGAEGGSISNDTVLYGSCGNCALHKSQILALTYQEKGSGQMGPKQTPPAEWSRRKTRYDPPALREAIAAAQGLTEQIEGQIEIAAQLMGLQKDEVRPEVLKAAARTNAGYTGSTDIRRRRTEVILERRGPRIPRR
jgi:hypothetical protein